MRLCISPHLFSTPLILVLSAAPHTKPQSPNPQGGEKGEPALLGCPIQGLLCLPFSWLRPAWLALEPLSPSLEAA